MTQRTDKSCRRLALLTAESGEIRERRLRAAKRQSDAGNLSLSSADEPNQQDPSVSSVQPPGSRPVRHDHHPTYEPADTAQFRRSATAHDLSPAKRAHPRRDERCHRDRPSLIAALPPGPPALPRPLAGTHPRRPLGGGHPHSRDRRLRRGRGEHDTRGRRSAAARSARATSCRPNASSRSGSGSRG